MPLLYESYAHPQALGESVEDERRFTIELTGVPPPPFTCPVCGEVFTTEELLIEHMKLEHPLQYWFWFWRYDTLPAGKILLGGSIFAGVTLVAVALTRRKP